MRDYSNVSYFATALIQRLLTAAQSHYDDNSLLFYQFGSREAQLRDIELLKEKPELSIEQVLENKQEQFAQELKTKTLLYSLLKEADKQKLLLDISAYALLGKLRVNFRTTKRQYPTAE